MHGRILQPRCRGVRALQRSAVQAVWSPLQAPVAVFPQTRSCSQHALVEDVEKKSVWLGIRWVPPGNPEDVPRPPANAAAAEAVVADPDSEPAAAPAPAEAEGAAPGVQAVATEQPTAAASDTELVMSRFGPDDNVQALLEFAAAEEVVDAALEVTARQELHRWWSSVVDRLHELELDAVQAVLVLDCLVRMSVDDAKLVSKIVDCIECRYFGMELGVVDHPALERFLPMSDLGLGDVPATFQSIVTALPTSHKVKMILMDDLSRPTGRSRPPRPRPEPDAQKRWRVLEPIEMEQEEKKQFEKGRIRVKRVRHAEAKVTRMQPGKRLRATLGLQLCQTLPGASLDTLAEISQVCVFSKHRFLHGDFLDDFEDSLSRRIDSLDTDQVLPYLLAFTSAMRNFGSSSATRTWRRKLLPAIVRMMRSSRMLELLDSQRGFHPWLSGVHNVVQPAAVGEVWLLQSRAPRAAQLFVAVATARVPALDVELFDGLAAPLQDLIQRWHNIKDSSELVDSAKLLLPLEVLTDTLNACAACGVNSLGAGSLPEMLAEVFLAQFRLDIEEGRLELAAYNMADVAMIAHSVALLCDIREGLAEEVLGLLWEVSAPKLQETQPHLTFMLLNALVRAGSEALLRSRPLIEAVDKHLAQKLDYDVAALGRIGS